MLANHLEICIGDLLAGPVRPTSAISRTAEVAVPTLGEFLAELDYLRDLKNSCKTSTW
jgi:hypothetical protein